MIKPKVLRYAESNNGQQTKNKAIYTIHSKKIDKTNNAKIAWCGKPLMHMQIYLSVIPVF